MVDGEKGAGPLALVLILAVAVGALAAVTGLDDPWYFLPALAVLLGGTWFAYRR